jgi:son of sevenless-like protein
METDDEASDNDVAGLTTSQATSRAGTSVGTGLSAALPSNAGFGISRHPELPEPWVRRLADDGMAYYFVNQETGEIRWTAPELDTSSREDLPTRSFAASSHDHNTLEPNRLRTDSSASDSQQRDESSINRLSFCSDDSGACVLDEERTGSLPNTQEASSNGHNELDWARTSSPEKADINNSLVELTSAERSAQSLQQSLSPSTPQPVADLSTTAREAIMAVIGGIRATNFTNLDDSMRLDNLVQEVVVAIRNLLYVSAAPSGHIPSHVIPGPREARARRDTTASETLLKPAQRRVTATLSKLVLSARAIQYNSGSSVAETSMRLGGDAEELEHAVATFIAEVQRSQNTQLHSPTTLKRLRGVFSTTHIGLGLMGAGAAGSWKGLGWVSLVETDEAQDESLGRKWSRS